MRIYDVHFLPELHQPVVEVTCDDLRLDSGFFVFFDGFNLLAVFRCDQVKGITSNKAVE